MGLRIINDYYEQRRAGTAQPVLDPAKFADLDIDRDAWPAVLTGAAADR